MIFCGCNSEPVSVNDDATSISANIDDIANFFQEFKKISVLKYNFNRFIA